MAGTAAPGLTTDGVAIAGPADEAELRRILREGVMPGAVRLAMTREPDFFAGDGLAGANDLTLISRQAGHAVGMGRLSVNTLMRDGVPRRIGYLGGLRVTGGTRQSVRMLRDGYQLLADRAGGDVDGYFTSIAADNARARRVLENGVRLGLPEYRPLCQLVTLVAAVRAKPEPAAAPVDDGELLSFLRQEVPLGDLSLAWEDAQWRALAGHGVTARNFAVVRHGGAIVAAAGVWDQRPFRQTVIDGYSRGLAVVRPLVNAIQRIAGHPSLPAPETALPLGALLGATVREPADWRRLWPAVSARAASLGLSYLMVARDARDPELPVLRRLTSGRAYRTILYDVRWLGTASGMAQAPGPRPHAPRFRPEVGLL